MIKIVCDRCSVNEIINIQTCQFTINIYIFRHLNWEIVIAISAPGKKK